MLFGKNLKLLCLILYAIGQIFIAINGQKLNKKIIHLVTLTITGKAKVTESKFRVNVEISAHLTLLQTDEA